MNFDHFDHLYTTMMLKGSLVGVVRIYARAFGKEFVGAPKEGDACVDDAARAIILLARIPILRRTAQQQRQLEGLTRFLLAMQNTNGYFNNFVWSDGRINTRYPTSVARLDWWSLRALWALEVASRALPPAAPLGTALRPTLARLLANLTRDLGPTASGVGRDVRDGVAADKTALALIGLLMAYERSGNAALRPLIETLGGALVRRQIVDPTQPFTGLYLSWHHEWHAWGNLQAYALLLAGAHLHRADFTNSALREVGAVYRQLLKSGSWARLQFKTQGARTVLDGKARFPQIAYGVAPMVFAAMQAYRSTGQTRYLQEARGIFGWFTGHNVAHRPMYDAATGRVFDGITSPGRVNPNSGAESTIEGLLALQALREGGK